MYTDPSGETANCPTCPDVAGGNTGFSNTEQAATGNIITSFANFFKDPQNAAWFRNNVVNSFVSDIKSLRVSDFVSKNYYSAKNDVNRFFSKLFGGGKSSSGGGTVEPTPFPQDGSSSWTGGSGGSFGSSGYTPAPTNYGGFAPDTRTEYEKAYARSGMASPMGSPFDLTGAWEAFFGELFSSIGDNSPETAIAFALVTKGKGNIATSTKALNGLLKATEKASQHGNSLKSLKPTWGYKLYSTDGTFLKNGITNKLIPETRYTRTFMSDKFMKPIPFPN
jgi:hypothetical protein